MKCINGNECDMRTLIKPMRVVDRNPPSVGCELSKPKCRQETLETRCRTCYRLV